MKVKYMTKNLGEKCNLMYTFYLQNVKDFTQSPRQIIT